MSDIPTSSHVTYESMLNSSLEYAMSEGSAFFQERGNVHQTMRRIAAKLDELGIPYAVAGGMSLVAHGFRRFTEDVDILVTKESLERIHQELEGRGYLPPFANSRHLRDTETHVKIEFLVSGGFPGDGKSKPVSFPDPKNVAELVDGIRFLNLQTVIELKLASGMTSAHRSKDLVDVEQLINTLKLPRTFADRLNPYVQSKFFELWDRHQPTVARYFRAIRDGENEELAHQMQIAGVEPETSPDQMLAPGFTLFVTTDPKLAAKFDMTPATEYFRETNQD